MISDLCHIYSLIACVRLSSTCYCAAASSLILVGLSFPSSKNLTWRDMQHLVVRTSHPNHLLTNDWRTNGVGRKGTAPSTFLTVSNNPKLPLVNRNVQKALKLEQLLNLLTLFVAAQQSSGTDVRLSLFPLCS